MEEGSDGEVKAPPQATLHENMADGESRNREQTENGECFCNFIESAL